MSVTNLSGNAILGITRETKSKWERRCPLSPTDVQYLIKEHGLRILIQPSSRRVYPDISFSEAGAEINEDLSSCGTILAVKEVPLSFLLSDRTYLFFSHTIKAQHSNMALLDSLVEKRIRLIDYETITEDGSRGGTRLVAFGRFAGIAGVVGFLRGLGERLLGLGYSTPFLHIGSMYSYSDVASAFDAVKKCGEAIKKFGLPPAICPLTIVITGNGKVAQGAIEVWKLLPHVFVDDPFSLKDIVTTKKETLNMVYLTIATAEHMVRKNEGCNKQQLSPISPSSPSTSPLFPPLSLNSPASIPDDIDVDCSLFDKKLYKAHPELFEPIFHIKVVPFASVICNCMYWENKFPRLLTINQTKTLAASHRLRLLGVTDISCDFTHISHPLMAETVKLANSKNSLPSIGFIIIDMRIPAGAVL
jgi:alpha-aminoadipic semialdehyde synthase